MKVTLKALRVNADLNQKEAAERIGTTARTIQNWESNETFPTAAQLMKICTAYNCTLNDIYLPDTLAKS